MRKVNAIYFEAQIHGYVCLSVWSSWYNRLTSRARFVHCMCVVFIVLICLASLPDSVVLPGASLTRLVMRIGVVMT